MSWEIFWWTASATVVWGMFTLGVLLGSWYGLRTAEPTPCERKHRDEL